MRRLVSITWLELCLHILESHFLLFGLLFYYMRNHEIPRADPTAGLAQLVTAHAKPTPLRAVPPTEERFLLQTQEEGAASCPQFT